MHYNTMNTMQKNTLTKLNILASPVLATCRLVEVRFMKRPLVRIAGICNKKMEFPEFEEYLE